MKDTYAQKLIQELEERSKILERRVISLETYMDFINPAILLYRINSDIENLNMLLDYLNLTVQNNPAKNILVKR